MTERAARVQGCPRFRERIRGRAGTMKRILVGASVLVLLCAAALSWYLWPRRHRYYTDGDLIRQPARTAVVREILWQPPQMLADAISSGADDYEPRLSADGQTLSAVITLHDPENYRRPPVRRRAWTRNPDTWIFPNECDPDSFFRQMYNEQLLDMYFDRSRRRF